MYTWGLNGTGQLGLGSRQDTPAPSLVNLFGLRVRRVALGAYHTLLVTCNGDLLSCGAGARLDARLPTLFFVERPSLAGGGLRCVSVRDCQAHGSFEGPMLVC